MIEIRLSVDYDEYENGVRISQLIEQLTEKPNAANISVLTIGDWGQAYENGPEDAIESLIKHKHIFTGLSSVFLGDMESEECEVSWINQTNIAPLLEAYPNLRSLTVKGSTNLSFEPLQHAALQELKIICGGLPKSVIKEIAGSQLPELRRLELYLGVDNYGFDASLQEVLAVAKPELFPKLTYLGLKNSEIQDEIAIAIADSSIVDQLDTLDLSYGTLTDVGAEALITSERIKKLKHLDLNYHYMSEKMIERWKATGLSVDLSDEQDADEDDWRYPCITE
ncbi:STM4015 family protein [Paenibacillus algorifonticola]|uniref:STM4015 family protein n=1 Tax=Paenibacillus algorifonticola TaxID=684063 RepID=UPI003D26B8C1